MCTAWERTPSTASRFRSSSRLAHALLCSTRKSPSKRALSSRRPSARRTRCSAQESSTGTERVTAGDVCAVAADDGALAASNPRPSPAAAAPDESSASCGRRGAEADAKSARRPPQHGTKKSRQRRSPGAHRPRAAHAVSKYPSNDSGGTGTEGSAARPPAGAPSAAAAAPPTSAVRCRFLARSAPAFGGARSPRVCAHGPRKRYATTAVRLREKPTSASPAGVNATRCASGADTRRTTASGTISW
mmetsp:Transcript_793/g.3085  ORF Transcript_793/g.3085 Transcript_793/m.3085 type:complete len:246 (+) Transcript_793:1807-2544(+)